ncbi:hypothetical protein C8R45DRAFT_436063 [Mycena sanguinolenta]|nr:hypothetical protein C8R45DRAFT_436063 [Mycena sanguinolenta]
MRTSCTPSSSSTPPAPLLPLPLPLMRPKIARQRCTRSKPSPRRMGPHRPASRAPDPNVQLFGATRRAQGLAGLAPAEQRALREVLVALMGGAGSNTPYDDWWRVGRGAWTCTSFLRVRRIWRRCIEYKKTNLSARLAAPLVLQSSPSPPSSPPLLLPLHPRPHLPRTDPPARDARSGAVDLLRHRRYPIPILIPRPCIVSALASPGARIRHGTLLVVHMGSLARTLRNTVLRARTSTSRTTSTLTTNVID